MTSDAAAPWRAGTVAEAQRIMAAALRPATVAAPALGGITLTPAQVALVDRAVAAVARWGGALLSATTGAGKTYIALATFAPHQDLVIIAPAALRAMWTDALARSGRSARFVSVERLSRGPVPRGRHTAVIIDEAHHLRNPRARRYAPAQALCRGVPVLLLTATPVHNRRAELLALLQLFLGAHAADLDAAALGGLLLHSAAQPQPGLPRVEHHAAHALPDDRMVLRSILALPPPVPPRDGGTALALWRLSLLRAWCSSAQALDAMLRRAQLAAAALADAVTAGRAPTRAELRAWSDADGQLAWPELMISSTASPHSALDAVHAHRRAVQDLRSLVATRRTVEDARVAQVAALLDSYADRPVLLCTQYAATVDLLWRRLRQRPGVAALTGRGGRIASGLLTREGVLARFAPVAQGRRPPPARERIRVLITTDVLSEGLNLQDAGVLVHVDMPWTPARLAQREGRLLRPGSPYAVVHVHRLRAPAAAAALLTLERRLAAKRRAARDAGRSGRAAALIPELIGGWASAAGHPGADTTPIVAACIHPRAFTLACVRDPFPQLIVAGRDHRFSSAPARVAPILAYLNAAAEGPVPAPPVIAPLLRAVHRHLQHQAAARVAMAGGTAAALMHRSAVVLARHRIRVGGTHERVQRAAQSSATLAQLAALPNAESRAPHDPGPTSTSTAIIAIVSSFGRTHPTTSAAPP